MATSTNWTAQTNNKTNWANTSPNTTNFGLNYDSTVLYDSSTDNYDGTTLNTSNTDFFYDGALPLIGLTTNWTAS